MLRIFSIGLYGALESVTVLRRLRIGVTLLLLLLSLLLLLEEEERVLRGAEQR